MLIATNSTSKNICVTPAPRVDSFSWSDPGPGLDDDVLFSLGYMMDIESHTVIYMKELLSTSVAEDPSLPILYAGVPEFFRLRVLKLATKPRASPSTMRDSPNCAAAGRRA